MTKGDKAFIGLAAAALVLGVAFAISLQPQQPNFAGDRGYQKQPATYRAGGAECEPAKIQTLPAGQRQSKADSCAQAQEEHRDATNSLIEDRRSAIATEAGAFYTAIQARIEAWGAALGLLTLLAAVAAAWFAKKAADHTETSANQMRETNEISRESKRPVLIYAGMEWTPYPNHPGVGRYGHVLWKNIGERPARLVRLEIGLKEVAQMAGAGNVRELLQNFQIGAGDEYRRIVMPEVTHSSVPITVSIQNFEPKTGGLQDVYLVARIVYVDALAGKYQREFTTGLLLHVYPLVEPMRPGDITPEEEADWPAPKQVRDGPLTGQFSTGTVVGYEAVMVSHPDSIEMT